MQQLAFYTRVKSLSGIERARSHCQYQLSPSCPEDTFLKKRWHHKVYRRDQVAILNSGAVIYFHGLSAPCSGRMKQTALLCGDRWRVWGCKKWTSTPNALLHSLTPKRMLISPLCSSLWHTHSIPTEWPAHSPAVRLSVSRMIVEPLTCWGVRSPLHNKTAHGESRRRSFTMDQT